MIDRVLIVPDVHMTQEGYAKPYKLVKEFMAGFKPHETILLGDFMNCDSLSHWNEDKRKTMEGLRYRKECSIANSELDYMQRYSKRVVYMEGNHENWVTQYIEHHPELEGEIEIPYRLQLTKRNIRWYGLNSLYPVGKIHFLHGIYTNKYHANKHLIAFGCSVCYCHTHTAQTAQMNMKMQDPIMAYGLGCLCNFKAPYLRNKPSNWINQFAVMLVHSKTGNFNLYPINITDDQFRWNKKEFK